MFDAGDHTRALGGVLDHTTRGEIFNDIVARCQARGACGCRVPRGRRRGRGGVGVDVPWPSRTAGSAPRWVSQAHRLGAAPARQQIGFGVLLRMRDQAAAAANLQAISDPTSASYGQWLSNAAFDARYAPAQRPGRRGAGLAARRRASRSPRRCPAACTSRRAARSRRSSGPSATAAATTTRYQGKTVRANATRAVAAGQHPGGGHAARSPASSAIDQGSTLKQPADTEPGPPPGARYGVQPCSRLLRPEDRHDKPPAYGTASAVRGLRLRAAAVPVGLRRVAACWPRGVNGRGVTVAITDAYAAPTILQDAQKYNQVHHQPLFRRGPVLARSPRARTATTTCDLCGAQGWYGEETLDVEAVHAMAPGAKIVYVGASDCLSGLDDAWAGAIDNHVADVITNSWTDGTDDINLLGTDLRGILPAVLARGGADRASPSTSPPATTATTPPAAPTCRRRPWSSRPTCRTSPASAAPAC